MLLGIKHCLFDDLPIFKSKEFEQFRATLCERMSTNEGNDPSSALLQQMFPQVCESIRNSTVFLAAKIDEACDLLKQVDGGVKEIIAPMSNLVTSNPHSINL